MKTLKEKAAHWKGILEELQDLYIVIGCGVTLTIEGTIVSLNDKTVRLSDANGYEHSCYLWDIRKVSC